MDFTKQKVKLPNGEVYYYITEGEGTTNLVLVHGNMSSSVHYLPLIKKLSKNYKIFAMDLRGFGDSTYNEPIQSLRDLADDVAMFCKELGIDKASFAGWSTGGGIVLELASKYPNLVEKLILIESTTHKGYPIFKKDEKGQPIIGSTYASPKEMELDPVQVYPVIQAMQSKNAAWMSWLWNATIYIVNKPTPEDNDLFISESLKQRNLADIDWALATINMGDVPNPYVNGDGSIHNVKAKVLHIWSKNDIVVPKFMLDDNVNALKEQSTVKIYETGGHSPLVDNLDQLAKDIAEFIK